MNLSGNCLGGFFVKGGGNVVCDNCICDNWIYRLYHYSMVVLYSLYPIYNGIGVSVLCMLVLYLA